MSDTRDLQAFTTALQMLQADVPEMLNQLAVGEGAYAARQARDICKQEPGLINTGQYRLGFKAGTTARRSGRAYQIDVYNGVDYAKHLEYGFRSHFIPGKWEGNTFVYIPGYKPPKGEPAGMYVGPPGGYVRGRYVMKRAVLRTKKTQEARLKRKMQRMVQDRLKGFAD